MDSNGSSDFFDDLLRVLRTIVLVLQLLYQLCIVYRKFIEVIESFRESWRILREVYRRYQLLREERYQSRPAPPVIVDRLPVVVVDESFQENGEAVCLICHAPVPLGEPVTMLPCQHWFHTDCIGQWLLQSRLCPYCFRDVLLPPLPPRVQPPPLEPPPDDPPTDNSPKSCCAATATNIDRVEAADRSEDESYNGDVDAWSDEEGNGEEVFVYR